MSPVIEDTKTFKNVGEAFGWGMYHLARVGNWEPRIEVESLLGELLDCSPSLVYLSGSKKLDEEKTKLYIEMIRRRSRFEPVAYIQNKKNFMGLDFEVDSRVLVPRPETELLVEKAVREIKIREWDAPKILEIGTGSGCISVMLAKSFPKAEILTMDISMDAIQVAIENICKHEVVDQVSIAHSDLYATINDRRHKNEFDLIISNPPYISESEFTNLDEDLSYEPRLALSGGKDGFDVIRPLIQQAPNHLSKNGFMMLEIGAAQKNKTLDLMKQIGFSDLIAWKDYGGHDRIVLGSLSGSV